MPLPPWLTTGQPIRAQYCLGNTGAKREDRITLRNDPSAMGGFSGTYEAEGTTGTITGISVGDHPQGGVVATFFWEEPGWSGVESLHFWQEDGKTKVWGSYTEDGPSGPGRCGQEWIE